MKQNNIIWTIEDDKMSFDQHHSAFRQEVVKQDLSQTPKKCWVAVSFPMLFKAALFNLANKVFRPSA